MKATSTSMINELKEAAIILLRASEQIRTLQEEADQWYEHYKLKDELNKVLTEENTELKGIIKDGD